MLEIRLFFFPLNVSFLHINQYTTNAHVKGNLVVHSPEELENKGFPLHGSKQVCSCLTAEDTFFKHSSTFSVCFSLGLICKQHSLEDTFCVPPWVTAEKESGLIISSSGIISLNLSSLPRF